MKAFFAVLLLSCGAACSGAQPALGPGGQTPKPSGADVEVPRTVITPQGGATIPELMREADALAKAKRWAAAAAAYDRVQRLDAEGSVGADALWGAADAYDRANDLEAAVVRFERVAQREPESERATVARLRATRIHVFRAHFAAAGLLADHLLKKLDALNDFAKITVYSAKALALIERGETEQASYFIEKGRDIVDAGKLDMAVPIDRDLAQLYYALGELRRSRATSIKFEPMPPNFSAVLEARCQVLLDAQSAYADAMRARDAHWSAMAGFRVAELYQDLHRDLMAVRPPPSADTERARQLWQGAVRTRYAILLAKAKTMAEQTVAMAAREGEKSLWVDKAREALAAIDQAMAEQSALLAKVSYTQADYDAYMTEQEAKASGKTPPKPAPKASPPSRVAKPPGTP